MRSSFLQSSITLADEVKSLDVTVDSEDTFDSHVGKVCHGCCYHPSDLRCIHKFQTVDTVVLQANATVSSCQ